MTTYLRYAILACILSTAPINMQATLAEEIASRPTPPEINCPKKSSTYAMLAGTFMLMMYGSYQATTYFLRYCMQTQ